MASNRHPAAAILVLANYVLALTVGEGLHVHGPYRRAAQREHSASGPSHPLGLCQEGSSDASRCRARHRGERTGTLAGHCCSETCPVCQFLAQKPAPDRSIEAVAWTGAAWESVVPKPVRRVDRVAAAHPIRGPPSFA
jgi:hypothetical protein